MSTAIDPSTGQPCDRALSSHPKYPIIAPTKVTGQIAYTAQTSHPSSPCNEKYGAACANHLSTAVSASYTDGHYRHHHSHDNDNRTRINIPVDCGPILHPAVVMVENPLPQLHQQNTSTASTIRVVDGTQMQYTMSTDPVPVITQHEQEFRGSWSYVVSDSSPRAASLEIVTGHGNEEATEGSQRNYHHHCSRSRSSGENREEVNGSETKKKIRWEEASGYGMIKTKEEGGNCNCVIL